MRAPSSPGKKKNIWGGCGSCENPDRIKAIQYDDIQWGEGECFTKYFAISINKPSIGAEICWDICPRTLSVPNIGSVARSSKKTVS